MLANSRHQWNRLGHCARNQAWICRLVGLEQAALHSFDVGSFLLSLFFLRDHAACISGFTRSQLPVVVVRTSPEYFLVVCATASVQEADRSVSQSHLPTSKDSDRPYRGKLGEQLSLSLGTWFVSKSTLYPARSSSRCIPSCMTARKEVLRTP